MSTTSFSHTKGNNSISHVLSIRTSVMLAGSKFWYFKKCKYSYQSRYRTIQQEEECEDKELYLWKSLAPSKTSFV
ncbi:hypothetical protein RIF29_14863 [Crotalaria pallida]|uniref:Uncharacterized protein n=1 Tax=Crotalaria pallida TaxID=3830 RepID=A0AAN9FE13_CROPI